jgi:hypothetical protein
MAASITTLAKLGWSAIGGSSPATQQIDFADFDLGISQDVRDLNGTRGKYNKDFGRVRKNLIHVEPSFRSEPTAVELAAILEWVMGGTVTGTTTKTYPFGNAAGLRYLAFDPGAGNLWNLTGVAVDSFTLSGSQGEPMSVSLGLLGQAYTVSGSFPALSLDISTQPFLFIDCALTVNGSTTTIADFSLSISNGLDRGRFFNSSTLTALNKLNRTTTIGLTIPYGDFTSLFGYGVNGTGAVGSIVATFTNGGSVLTVTAANVGFAPQSPSSPFQAEGFLTLSGECFSSSLTTDPITITLANGP